MDATSESINRLVLHHIGPEIKGVIDRSPNKDIDDFDPKLLLLLQVMSDMFWLKGRLGIVPNGIQHADFPMQLCQCVPFNERMHAVRDCLAPEIMMKMASGKPFALQFMPSDLEGKPSSHCDTYVVTILESENQKPNLCPK